MSSLITETLNLNLSQFILFFIHFFSLHFRIDYKLPMESQSFSIFKRLA